MSQVSHTAIDDGATTPALHFWPPRPSDMELCARRPLHIAGLCLLQIWLENLAGTSVRSTLETFATIALYKSTYTIPWSKCPTDYLEIVLDLMSVQCCRAARIRNVWQLLEFWTCYCTSCIFAYLPNCYSAKSFKL